MGVTLADASRHNHWRAKLQYAGGQEDVALYVWILNRSQPSFKVQVFAYKCELMATGALESFTGSGALTTHRMNP